MLGPPPIDRAVPSGCILGFFGVLALIFSGLSGWAGWRVFESEFMRHQDTAYSYGWLFAGSGAGLVAGAALLYYGGKLAMLTGAYETRHNP